MMMMIVIMIAALFGTRSLLPQTELLNVSMLIAGKYEFDDN